MSQVLISADCHLMEPPDLWTTRLPKEMRDQAVRLEYTGHYMHFYRAGGYEFLTLSRYRDLDRNLDHTTDLAERKDAMDADGVWGEVVHSNLAFFAYQTSHDLAVAHARVYNDYLHEVFAHDYDRHKPTAMIPLTDVDDAVAEIERVAGLGIEAIMPPMNPPQRYSTNTYDRVWAAAQAHGMVVFFHVGAGMTLGEPDPLVATTKGTMFREAGIDTDEEVQTSPVHANRLRGTVPAAMDPQNLMADLIGAGIPERFPGLHFVITEFNAYWLAGFMAGLDKAYAVGIGQDVSEYYAEMGSYDHGRPEDDQPAMVQRFRLNRTWPYPLRPSEYVRRQFHTTFQDDPGALALRHFTGIEPLLWGSDYPHHEGTWPRTIQNIPQQFADLTPDETAAITGGTLAKLLGFKPPSAT